MADSHYFSPPEGPFETHEVGVELAGRPVRVSTAAGIFSPGGVDKGTAVLLSAVPDPAQHGELLDLGCGWGPIALTMGMLCPEARVWAIDVNERARALCAQNASALGVDNVHVAAPEEVPDELEFSTIWSNPPIRVGKPVLHQMLKAWLPRLDEAGEAWLVVQKNLGADSLQKWLAAEFAERFSVERPQSSKGFRLLHVVNR